MADQIVVPPAEITRLHRLTQDEADLIHEYRLLGDAFKLGLRTMANGLVMDESAKASPVDGNIVRLFPD